MYYDNCERTDVLCSWLSEYVYCKRAFYLRIVESNDLSNMFITEGKLNHEAVDKLCVEKRRDKITVTGLPVFSKELGLYGICDRIDFLRGENKNIYIPFLGEYVSEICPVEYKRGKKKEMESHKMQVAGQMVCLEEMFDCDILLGRIYHRKSKNFIDVVKSEQLYSDLRVTVESIRLFLAEVYEPEPVYSRSCHSCSLYDICCPKDLTVINYMNKMRRYYLCDK